MGEWRDRRPAGCRQHAALCASLQLEDLSSLDTHTRPLCYDQPPSLETAVGWPHCLFALPLSRGAALRHLTWWPTRTSRRNTVPLTQQQHHTPTHNLCITTNMNSLQLVERHIWEQPWLNREGGQGWGMPAPDDDSTATMIVAARQVRDIVMVGFGGSSWVNLWGVLLTLGKSLGCSTPCSGACEHMHRSSC
jgi:hypothetical protein